MVETEFVDSDTEAGTSSRAHPVLEISAHRSSPDRVVLVEAENSDGWIAFDADAAVSIDR
jgi:hypothetical protein